MEINNNVPPPKPKHGRAPTLKKALTAQEREMKRAKKSLADAKRKETWAKRKLKALTETSKVLSGQTAVVETSTIEDATPTLQEYMQDQKIIFQPNPGPQEDFLASDEREVLYGGAAGGGKSYALLADVLRYAGIGEHRAIIFRRTNDQLRELVFKSREMYPQAFPGAKWSEQKSTWTFPSGATIWFTYLDRDDDVLRYQGQAFNYVGFDELTQWPSAYPWDYMRSRLRTTHPDLPLYMRATTNPGGPGSWWVRKMFIEPAPWGEAFAATDMETGEVLTYPKNHAKYGTPLFYRRFIPARLSDNPYLFEDGQYETNLLSLPEAQRRQLLEGDWDICEGSAFPEFHRPTHVCEPFEIPSSWVKFRAADWGYSSPACCLWFAVDHDNELWVYRELYVKHKTADEFADMVLDAEFGEEIRYGVLDVSAWNRRGETGPSIAETMTLRGCRWRPSDRSKNSRVSGKLELHRRLSIDEMTERPRLHIFNTCVNLIRTLPVIPLDKNNAEDVDTTSEDHAYDALRYGCSSRPVNPSTIMRTFSAPNLDHGIRVSVDETFGY